jgi:HlyD family secretion protein
MLLRLEDAQTRAELSIVRSQLAELTARRARLIAERDGLARIEFPAGLSEESLAAAIAVKGEARLFAGNRVHRESQKQQLELQVDQIGEEIRGLEAQRSAKLAELALVETQFNKIKGLLDKGLIEAPRVYTVERELAQLLGERGEIDAGIARAKTRMGEIRVQILAVDENARTEAQRELSLVVTRLSELQERRTAIEDRLSRTDIRAPISGIINELNIHTIGGVITPAEVLATIVPEDARLKVEVRIPPVSIDQVAVDQRARLRFSSFNQRTTPELDGRVVRVSPATSRDATTGEVYYLADVEALPGELAKLGGKTLIPGMPVEVFITTEDRTALSYIVKPFTDQFMKAFREE